MQVMSSKKLKKIYFPPALLTLLEEQKEQRLQAVWGFSGSPVGGAQHVPWVFQVLLYWQQENVLGEGMAVVRFMFFLFLVYLCFMSA